MGVRPLAVEGMALAAGVVAVHRASVGFGATVGTVVGLLWRIIPRQRCWGADLAVVRAGLDLAGTGPGADLVSAMPA